MLAAVYAPESQAGHLVELSLFSLPPKSVSKGLSSLMDPVLEIVHQRIDMGSRNIRIMAKVLGRIERR